MGVIVHAPSGTFSPELNAGAFVERIDPLFSQGSVVLYSRLLLGRPVSHHGGIGADLCFCSFVVFTLAPGKQRRAPPGDGEMERKSDARMPGRSSFASARLLARLERRDGRASSRLLQAACCLVASSQGGGAKQQQSDNRPAGGREDHSQDHQSEAATRAPCISNKSAAEANDVVCGAGREASNSRGSWAFVLSTSSSWYSISVLFDLRTSCCPSHCPTHRRGRKHASNTDGQAKTTRSYNNLPDGISSSHETTLDCLLATACACAKSSPPHFCRLSISSAALANVSARPACLFAAPQPLIRPSEACPVRKAKRTSTAPRGPPS
jgi:hypothetical protein